MSKTLDLPRGYKATKPEFRCSQVGTSYGRQETIKSSSVAVVWWRGGEKTAEVYDGTTGLKFVGE